MSNRWNDNFSLGLLERGECRDDAAKAAISSYLDGEADSEERRTAEYHLASCPSCQNRAVNWRQVGRLLSNTTFTDGPTYQIQAEVRQELRAFLSKEASKPVRRPIPVLAFASGTLAAVALLICAFLLTQTNGPILLNPTTTTLAMSGSAATVRAAGTLTFSPMNRASLPTPTVAVSSFNLPPTLNAQVKGAATVRTYPAPAGRFSGWTAIVAWYSDKSNKLWIVSPQQSENEVSLSALADVTEPVRFYYDDPQAVIWSERGALVSYHLNDTQSNEWGLVVPQVGQTSATRLVQPPTAAAIAHATTTALAARS